MTLRSRIRRAAGRAGRLKRVDRFVERREEYFLKFVTSLRVNCVVVNKEQYPECSSISEMDTKAAHCTLRGRHYSGPNLTPSIARLSRVVYTARQLSCFSLSRPAFSPIHFHFHIRAVHSSHSAALRPLPDCRVGCGGGGGG